MRTVWLALCLAACAARVPITAAEPPAEATMLPTPYTAEQIRDAMPVGTRITLQQATPQGVVGRMAWTVVTATPEGMSMLEQPEGAPADAGTVDDYTWQALRDHARFPAATTTRERTAWADVLGHHEGWHYVRTEDTDAGPVLHHFWFSDDHPGPPLRMTQERGPVTLFEMTVVARTQP